MTIIRQLQFTVPLHTGRHTAVFAFSTEDIDQWDTYLPILAGMPKPTPPESLASTPMMPSRSRRRAERDAREGREAMNNSASSDPERHAERSPRNRRLWLWLTGACAYVLLGTTGLVVAANTIGFTVLLWVLFGVGLLVLLFRLGGIDAGCSATMVVLLASFLAFGTGSIVWDDLVLQHRGRTTEAVVVEERIKKGSRGERTWYYELVRRSDGTPVPGGELVRYHDRFDVGQTITVIADPEGELRPETPGHASPVGDLIGFGGAVAVSLGAVGWAAFGKRKGKSAGGPEQAPGDPDQEQRLRELLRARDFDRRGYIRVSPGAFRGLTQQRAARIAYEEGLRTEAFGNRGYWRFGEKVVEEVDPGIGSRERP